VAEGMPEKVARVPASPTGMFLKGILGLPSLRLVNQHTVHPTPNA
jgi:hypothetical protein